MVLRMMVLCMLIIWICSIGVLGEENEPASLRTAANKILIALTSGDLASLTACLMPESLIVADNQGEQVIIRLCSDHKQAGSILAECFKLRASKADIEQMKLDFQVMSDDSVGKEVKIALMSAQMRSGKNREKMVGLMRRDGENWRLMLLVLGGIQKDVLVDVPSEKLSEELKDTGEGLLSYFFDTKQKKPILNLLSYATLALPNGEVLVAKDPAARNFATQKMPQALSTLRMQTRFLSGLYADSMFQMLGPRIILGKKMGFICPSSSIVHLINQEVDAIFVKFAEGWQAVSLCETFCWCCSEGRENNQR